MKKLLAVLTGAAAAAFFWRRRSQPSRRQRAVDRARAGIALGLDRSRAATDQVKERLERRRDEAPE